MAEDIQPRIEAKYNGRQAQVSIYGDGVQVFRLYAWITFMLSNELGMGVYEFIARLPDYVRLYIDSISQHSCMDENELRRQCREGSHG